MMHTIRLSSRALLPASRSFLSDSLLSSSLRLRTSPSSFSTLLSSSSLSSFSPLLSSSAVPSFSHTPYSSFRTFHFDGSLSTTLQREADMNPNDGMKQYILIKEWIRQKKWEDIENRFRDPRFSFDPRAFTEYSNALKISRVDRTSSPSPAFFSPLSSNSSSPPSLSPSLGSQPFFLSPSTPTPVSVTGPVRVEIQGKSSKSFLDYFNLAWQLALGCTIITFAAYSIFRTDSKGSGGLSLIGMKSRVHRTATLVDVSFKDVLGCDEAKEQLEDIVSYLKFQEKFLNLGASLPKGVLLVGAPGTGKTLLARAIAGEANVPFYYANGSEFDEVFVGVGSKRIRELFEEAKANAPCIVFIDEIDSLGQRRNSLTGNKNETLNQLLSELDGFQKNNGVVLIGATNFPDLLDNALKRSGRFDKIVNVPVPDIKGRQEILAYYLSKVKIGPDISEALVKKLARTTIGMTGADLSNLVNQAAVKAAVGDLKYISAKQLEEAYDDMIMGAARKSAVISPEEKRLTAYHEGGHAIVAWYTQDSGSNPIRKVTILPRGAALGYVAQLPDKDQTSYSRKQMLSQIAVALAGRLAEEIIFGAENITSGASSDLKNASRLASEMVLRWGMSEKVGPYYIEQKDNRSNEVSGKMLEKVDEEVSKILSDQQERARTILQNHMRQLHLLAEALIEYETLNHEEIGIVLNGGRLNR